MSRRVPGAAAMLAFLNGRMSRFAVIGAFGAVANVALMAVLVSGGVNYLVAAVIGTEVTIISNFLLQERFVFAVGSAGARPVHLRFLSSFLFNNVETAVRMPVLWLLVDGAGIFSPVAQFGTLAAAFVLRYLFHARVVYQVAVPAIREPEAVGSSR